MENKIHFQLTTADGAVCDEMVSFVMLPLSDGDAGILAGHAAMIAALREGVIKYVIDNEEHFAAVSGGVMSVADNDLIVLARSAELAENIDIARAIESEKRARARLESKRDDLDASRATLSLHRALAREKAYGYIHKD